MSPSGPHTGTADPLALHGVVPPVVTAFDTTGAVDEEATVAHAQFVINHGATAVFPLGTNGEFAMLTGDERRRVIDCVTTAVDVPVIAGVGCPSTRETIAHAKHAARVGADGVVVVTPYYYPVDSQGMVAHYQAVADAVDIPVYLYHIPSTTGNTLSLTTLTELAAIDGVAGIKDSSKDVPWLAQAIDDNPELTFLVGSDSLLLSGLDRGCAGVVSAVANVFPELVVELYEAYRAGERHQAQDLQSTIFDIRSALKQGPYMAGVKTALALRDPGFDVGSLRSPLRMMDTAGRRQLKETLTALDVLDE